eukprot:scaffold4124_cov252-Pinguiococcus_pyrenoidosus.AAC.2
MSEKDKVDIAYGVENDMDFVAASFVRKASDVEAIRAFVADKMKENNFGPDALPPLIISKIESTEAIDNFKDILKASDGIMVARGDLGVEIPMERVTNAQKEMVRLCNEAGKPVIVATQMLESMQKNPRPTRAEVADVTNAVYDGADAVMLSGESAKGLYPVESIQFMREVIGEAERWWRKTGSAGRTALQQDQLPDAVRFEDPGKSSRFAIAQAGVLAAERVKCSAIIVSSAQHADLAPFVSRCRPSMPIVLLVTNAKLGRQMQLYRGVHPVLVEPEILASQSVRGAVEVASSMGFVKEGDSVAFVKEFQDTAVSHGSEAWSGATKLLAQDDFDPRLTICIGNVCSSQHMTNTVAVRITTVV